MNACKYGAEVRSKGAMSAFLDGHVEEYDLIGRCNNFFPPPRLSLLTTSILDPFHKPAFEFRPYPIANIAPQCISIDSKAYFYRTNSSDRDHEGKYPHIFAPRDVAEAKRPRMVRAVPAQAEVIVNQILGLIEGRKNRPSNTQYIANPTLKGAYKFMLGKIR